MPDPKPIYRITVPPPTPEEKGERPAHYGKAVIPEGEFLYIRKAMRARRVQVVTELERIRRVVKNAQRGE
jgi:hypothetical protein